MNRILVATDFSEAAGFAVSTAQRLARHTGAELALMHACNVSGAMPDRYELATGRLEPFRREVRNELARRRKEIRALREQLGATGLAVTDHIMDGAPVEAIASLAEELDVALVVVGTHAKGNLLLGSTTERVARTCTRPVLVTRRPMIGEDGYTRILCATDFEAQSENAAKLAMHLAAAQAEVEVFHAWTLGRRLEPLALAQHRDAYMHLREDALVESSRQAHVVSGHLYRSGLDITVAVREGPAAAAILERAEQWQPELITVGSHGHSPAQRLFLGSVAEKIARYAPCSVLISR